jgi:hypothetical protein
MSPPDAEHTSADRARLDERTQIGDLLVGHLRSVR